MTVLKKIYTNEPWKVISLSTVFQRLGKAAKGVFATRPFKSVRGQSRFALIWSGTDYKTKIRILTALLVGISCAVTLTIGHYASPDFTAIAAALICFCGLVFYDVATRRMWEKQLTAEMNRLTDYHDRLVREVARNRNDIAILKEGLGETATIVHKQGRKDPYNSHSAEARMIETIAKQLGHLGSEPRAVVESRADNNVLELEITPPPYRKPIPAQDGQFDDGFNPNKLSDADVLNLIRNAVRSDTIDVFEQPVVTLPQRKVRMKEIYARIRVAPGAYLPAARYMDLAQKEKSLPAIDNLLLLRCLQMLRSEKDSKDYIPYILNITTQTLNDKGFMNDLLTFLAQNRKMAGKIIFEMPQADINAMDHTMVPIIEGLSHLGCRFSMDRVTDRRIDINILKKMQMRFIKLDSNWLLKEGATKEGFSRILRLKRQLDAAGIDMIIEKIETEASVRELLDFTIDYGQGFLFGKPDLTLNQHTRTGTNQR